MRDAHISRQSRFDVRWPSHASMQACEGLIAQFRARSERISASIVLGERADETQQREGSRPCFRPVRMVALLVEFNHALTYFRCLRQILQFPGKTAAFFEFFQAREGVHQCFPSD